MNFSFARFRSWELLFLEQGRALSHPIGPRQRGVTYRNDDHRSRNMLLVGHSYSVNTPCHYMVHTL